MIRRKTDLLHAVHVAGQAEMGQAVTILHQRRFPRSRTGRAPARVAAVDAAEREEIARLMETLTPQQVLHMLRGNAEITREGIWKRNSRMAAKKKALR